MSLDLLLEAVDYIERRDAAPTVPVPAVKTASLYKVIWNRGENEKSGQFMLEEVGEGQGEGETEQRRHGTREVHNKLEKNRRAHLKDCFELIKQQLPPLGADSRKQSHLSILHNAIKYIQVLRRKDREFEHEMERLAREKIALQQRLGQLKKELGAVYDNVDFGSLLPDEPISDPEPKMISFTATKTPTGHLATALLSPLHVLQRDEPAVPEEAQKRFVTISRAALPFKQNVANSGHAALITPVPITVVSQGKQIAQIITTAPSSKLVTPFHVKPIVSQYLVKHGSAAVVVRNQTSPLTQTSSN